MICETILTIAGIVGLSLPMMPNLKTMGLACLAAAPREGLPAARGERAPRRYRGSACGITDNPKVSLTAQMHETARSPGDDGEESSWMWRSLRLTR
jgi:hypothetical protein